MAHLQRALASLTQQEQAVSISLGPHGLDHLLVDEANQPIITNSGDIILSLAHPDDALGALIIKHVVASCASLGDACKRVFLMVLAGLREYLRSGLHPSTFQYDLAAQVLQCVVPNAVLHVPLPPGGPQPEDDAAEALYALICTHLCGKAGGPAAEQHLAATLQELVLLHLRAAAAAGLSAAEALSSLRDSPPLARLPGAPPSQSRLLRGVLLHEAPLTGTGPAGLLQSPTFLALSCPLDGEAITCVSGGNAAINDMTASPLGSAAGGGGGPPVAIQVVSEAHRGEVEAAAAELLQQRVALLAERGVNLLLLCGRPPPAATQLCHQHGICLVAGLDEQDVARACAAGGAAAPLTRAGLRVLAEAQLGRASAARVVLLGTRRAILLEFTEQQWQAAGQAACTLLLCGVSDAAIKQSVREVRRCLISIAAAVGTMAQHGIDAHARSGAEGGHGCGECLVFVAGGGGFEGLLEFQLRELSDVAKKGLPTSQTDEKVEEEEDLDDVELSNAGVAVAETGTAAEAAVDGVEDAAAEARAASELLASLRVLHAMAAVVPMALTGASGGGGGRGTSQRRVRREALLQVHALRQSQAAVLQRGELVRCGLVVPSAAASFHGRALHGVSGEEALEGWEAPFLRGADGQSKTSFIREQPAIGGDGFVAVPNAVHYGVVEAAAVAVSAWNHAVDVVRQVIRIEGAPVAAVSGSQLRGGGDGGVQVTVAGPAAVKMPRARRGGGGREWSSDSSSGGASDES